MRFEGTNVLLLLKDHKEKGFISFIREKLGVVELEIADFDSRLVALTDLESKLLDGFCKNVPTLERVCLSLEQNLQAVDLKLQQVNCSALI